MDSSSTKDMDSPVILACSFRKVRRDSHSGVDLRAQEERSPSVRAQEERARLTLNATHLRTPSTYLRLEFVIILRTFDEFEAQIFSVCFLPCQSSVSIAVISVISVAFPSNDQPQRIHIIKLY